MEGEIQISENLEIPSRWRRFFAYILDLIISITLIPIIINLIMIFVERTTLWNMLVWIKAINKNGGLITLKQTFLRYMIFYPTIPLLLILLYLSMDFLETFISLSNNDIYIPCTWNECNSEIKIKNILFYIFCVFSIPNIIEIFFKCPTFIDKRLWIKRFYKNDK